MIICPISSVEWWGDTDRRLCPVDGAITGAGEQRKAFLFHGFLTEHLRNASSRMPDIKAGTSFSEDLRLMVGQHHCCMPNDAWQPRLRDFQVMLAPGHSSAEGWGRLCNDVMREEDGRGQ